jgi:hypothetical protein
VCQFVTHTSPPAIPVDTPPPPCARTRACDVRRATQFFDQKQLFSREQSAGCVGPLEFWLASSLTTLISGAVFVTILFLPVYFLSGYDQTEPAAERLGVLAICLSALLLAHAVGHGLAEVRASQRAATG